MLSKKTKEKDVALFKNSIKASFWNRVLSELELIKTDVEKSMAVANDLDVDFTESLYLVLNIFKMAKDVIQKKIISRYE